MNDAMTFETNQSPWWLLLMGGIDKRAMAAGPEAIESERERVVPLLEEGGYVPWCDHHVPPDVSLEHYQYYVRRMQEVSADAAGRSARTRG